MISFRFLGFSDRSTNGWKAKICHVGSIFKNFFSDPKASATNETHGSDIEACRTKCCRFGSIAMTNF